MLIHAIIARSRVNGPGARAVVYFQGCNLGCPGCWNPSTHPFAGPNRSTESVAAEVLLNRELDGVTFSGGEPMQQASELLALVHCLKRTCPDFSVGLYSGYTERELESGAYSTRDSIDQQTRSEVWADLRSQIDFAVLGRFVTARPSRLPLRTSANQTLRLFGARYSESDFDSQECEVQIAPEGLVQITGFPLAGSPA
ncbi:MAG: radical SAM protein [Bryobacterales bacterium]|nr:radical SAM protein [Bryobacterales bacterium]